MTIATEIQSLSPTQMVEFFVLDLTPITPGEIMYFHSGINQLQQVIVWQGQQYFPLPIEAEGFDMNTKGTLPRPKIRLANVDGLFSAEVYLNDDFVGCKVTRKRTFARFLDAVNFPGGVNAEADPTQYLPDEIWIIDQKIAENRYIVEWELASAFDLQNVQLPARQMIKDTCTWKYRGADCGYTGTLYFDEADQSVSTSTADVCGKRVRSCRLRHQNVVVPFGGFPGLKKYE